MTSILILLGLLSVATLALRRGAFEELVQSASTPLLVGVGVLVSPAVLGLVPPSTIAGLERAVDVGAAALGLFVGARATRPTGSSIGARALVAGVMAVALSCVSAAIVLVLAAQIVTGDGATAPHAWRALAAGALFSGACLASLPAESERTEPRVRAWARVTEVSALVVAFAALALSADAPLPLLVVTVLVGASSAALLWLMPVEGAMGRAVVLLGVLAYAAGLMRLMELPTAAAGLLAGLLVGRSAIGGDTAQLARIAERPVRVVLTVVVAAAVGLDGVAVGLGALLALGQLVVQLVAARVMRVHRTLLGSALASSSTPIAWVAALLGAASVSGLGAVAPTVLAAVALSDALAVVVRLAQRRAWSEEQTSPGVADGAAGGAP